MGLDHYYIPEHYRDTLDNILINHGTIVDRVEKLAYDITQDYNGQTIHILCVLKGNLLLNTYTVGSHLTVY
jgi:hypoxanthine phosphoribosyltransferase